MSLLNTFKEIFCQTAEWPVSRAPQPVDCGQQKGPDIDPRFRAGFENLVSMLKAPGYRR